jgi:hypothetical protein
MGWNPFSIWNSITPKIRFGEMFPVKEEITFALFYHHPTKKGALKTIQISAIFVFQ